MQENLHPGPLSLDVTENLGDGWLELWERNEGESVFLSILPTTALVLAEKLTMAANQALGR